MIVRGHFRGLHRYIVLKSCTQSFVREKCGKVEMLREQMSCFMILIGVVDPHHGEADPDPRIRIEKNGSSSW